jgi:cytochrome c553
VSSEPPPRDRWPIFAGVGVFGLLGVAVAFGLVIVPVMQGMRTGIAPWVAICRAMGLSAGSAAARQPTGTAAAQPVSDVEWSPEIMRRLAGANRANGKRIAGEVCVACHGENGLSVDPAYPTIAGQSSAAIFKQLHDFRNGARVNPLMSPVARKLADTDLADIAAFFGRDNVDTSLLDTYRLAGDEHGIELVRRGDPSRQLPACNSCHGNHVGGPLETPTLAGLRQAYILRQLNNFASGARRNDLFGRMRNIARKLTPEEKEEVARTYQGVL